jgi:hypothetical protein
VSRARGERINIGDVLASKDLSDRATRLAEPLVKRLIDVSGRDSGWREVWAE